MAVDGITPYQQVTDVPGNANKGIDISMDDFFKLMVAQISNQDMFNTVDDTQFISQMAQFSMVQTLSELSRASATSYSISLIGKEASVARIGGNGNMETYTGIVDSVILYSGSPKIIIDGESYDLCSVMEVREPNIIIPNSSTVNPNETKGGEDDG